MVDISEDGDTWDYLGSWSGVLDGIPDETVCSMMVTAVDGIAKTSRCPPFWRLDPYTAGK